MPSINSQSQKSTERLVKITLEEVSEALLKADDDLKLNGVLKIAYI